MIRITYVQYIYVKGTAISLLPHSDSACDVLVNVRNKIDVTTLPNMTNEYYFCNNITDYKTDFEIRILFIEILIRISNCVRWKFEVFRIGKKFKLLSTEYKILNRLTVVF